MNIPIPVETLPPKGRDLVRRYEAYLRDPAPFFPERVTLEITSICNFDCPMCPRHFENDKEGMMPFDLWCRLVDEMAAEGARILTSFFRGESTLHKKWLDMLAYAKKKGIPTVQLTTNGSLLPEPKAKALLDVGIDFLSFSVDTMDPDAYKIVRTGGTLEKTLSNVEGFLRLKREGGYGKPEVQVSAVDTKWAHPHLGGFVKYWQGKVDRVRIYPEHSMEGKYGILAESERRFRGLKLPCHKPMTDLVVGWNGECFLCCYDWERKCSIGNVKDKPIREVWNGRPYQDMRRMHAGELPMNPLENCVHCDHWQNAYLDEGLTGTLHRNGEAAVRTSEDL